MWCRRIRVLTGGIIYANMTPYLSTQICKTLDLPARSALKLTLFQLMLEVSQDQYWAQEVWLNKENISTHSTLFTTFSFSCTPWISDQGGGRGQGLPHLMDTFFLFSFSEFTLSLFGNLHPPGRLGIFIEQYVSSSLHPPDPAGRLQSQIATHHLRSFKLNHLQSPQSMQQF